MTEQTIDQNRTPPHNIEAEQALLGALMHNNEALDKVLDFLKPEHFSNPLHGEIFAAIISLNDRGYIADPITIHDILKGNEEIMAAGGPKFLIGIADAIVSIINIKDYGQLIYDLFLRRQLINIGEELVNGSYKLTLEDRAASQIEKAEQNLYGLAIHGESSKGFTAFNAALTEAISLAEIAYKRDSKIVGVTSGLRALDAQLGGLHPSDLLIIAGRPSMGKTGFATNIAFNAASAPSDKGGGSVAFFSLEMSADQLATRILSHETGISSDKLRRGELHSSDFPKIMEVSKKLAEIPLYIDDTPALTVSAIRNRSRRLKRQKGLDLIVVDYLQLIQGSGREGRVQEISEITRGLKTLAKELHVPVIALSQLSRAVEQRDDKRPQLSDLRESGSIEQDADVVMFIYREEYYEARKQPPEGSEKEAPWQEKMKQIYNIADIIIAKQRHGPIGTLKFFYDSRLVKFGNLKE